MTRSLLPSPPFARALRRLLKQNPSVAPAIESTLALLAEDAFHPRLHTHKLRGGLSGRWASSAGYDLRIIIEFVQHEGVEAILLVDIGAHDEVY